MTSSKSSSKNSIKELYHEMKQRIRIVISLLGKPESNKSNPLPDENSFQTISNLLNSIMGSAQFENKNQYRDAIVEISNWLNCAFQKEYLTSNVLLNPNPLYTVKKGAEILHSFLHRDLRRKQLSSEEHEIYRNYMNLVSNLPEPRKIKMNQDDANSMLDDLLKSS